MKKLLILICAASMGFASSVWSGEREIENGLDGLMIENNQESLQVVSKPGRPIPPVLKTIQPLEVGSRPRPPIPPQ